MSQLLDKKSIIKKTVEVGSSTLLSRAFGLVREILKGRYLGTNAMADAFFVAFMIPNSLRKIFAEGALTAAFVPTIVSIVKKDNQKDANALMSLSFIVFEGMLALICILMFFNSETVVSFVASGFSPEKIVYTASLFRILCSFILFVSSSALLAGALQSVNHFWVPALGPVLLNVVFIASLAVCLWYGLPVNYLCYSILFGGIFNFIMHIIAYFKMGFSFSGVTPESKKQLKTLLRKFFPVMFSMSIMEINLLIDTSFSSYLPDGSVSVINYANRFMGIPLGVFAVAFSTILLPHFARVSLNEPKKLSFYLFEASKLVMWVTVPVAIFMGIFSKDIFATLFLSSKFPMAKIIQAKYVLIAFLLGLFFFSLNKILLNMYYVLHDTFTPMMISIVATIFNFGMNTVFVHWLGAPGLAAATSASGILQTGLFIYFLHNSYDFKFDYKKTASFILKFLLQVVVMFISFGVLYWLVKLVIGSGILNTTIYSINIEKFLLLKFGLWLWVGPLFLGLMFGFFKTRKYFGLEMYFLD